MLPTMESSASSILAALRNVQSCYAGHRRAVVAEGHASAAGCGACYSIHQCRAPPERLRAPLVGRMQAHPHLGSQYGNALMLVNVSTHQPRPAEGCEVGVRMSMHGWLGQCFRCDTRTMTTSQLHVS